MREENDEFFEVASPPLEADRWSIRPISELRYAEFMGTKRRRAIDWMRLNYRISYINTQETEVEEYTVHKYYSIAIVSAWMVKYNNNCSRIVFRVSDLQYLVKSDKGKARRTTARTGMLPSLALAPMRVHSSRHRFKNEELCDSKANHSKHCDDMLIQMMHVP